MSSHITIAQLEQMKTHELADLLANVVLVLRRMPDVPCIELQQQTEKQELTPPLVEASTKKPTRRGKTASTIEEQPLQQLPVTTIQFTQEELNNKKVAELRKIADELHIPISTKAKKEDLISKIMVRQGHKHSEQYAIRDI